MNKHECDGPMLNRHRARDGADGERTNFSARTSCPPPLDFRGDLESSNMGVQSLTTYVKKNNLGSYVYLPDPLGETGLPLIVDGMAWAYNVGLVDTFQGGSYAAIRANTRRYVEYWRACGLEPEVVWDGASFARSLQTK